MLKQKRITNKKYKTSNNRRVSLQELFRDFTFFPKECTPTSPPALECFLACRGCEGAPRRGGDRERHGKGRGGGRGRGRTKIKEGGKKRREEKGKEEPVL